MIGAAVGAQLIGAGISGLSSLASGLIGGGARRAEQRAARAEYMRNRKAYEEMQFVNPYKNLSNPFQNLTVNQQEAQFLAQQQQQGLANTMAGLQGAAGASGIASLAQAMANQQALNIQRAAASIGKQEAANQAMAAKGTMQIEMAQAQGEQYKQAQEFARTGTLLGMSQQRLAMANAARQQATQQLMGGIGKLAGAGLAMGANQGLFGDSLEGFLDAVPGVLPDSETGSDGYTNDTISGKRYVARER